MCTQPVEPGTATSRQLAPASSLSITALVSTSPTHLCPGTVTQWNTGSSQRPDGRTTTGWRTKTPPDSVAGNSVRTSPHVSPESGDTRQRTSAESWSPACWAVHSSHSVPSGAGNRTGFCSERRGSSDSWTAGVQRSPASRENQMEMSGTPSWVPPNHTHPRVPSGSVIRFAACTCTVVEGRKASRRSGSPWCSRSTPSVVSSVVVMSVPRGRRGGRSGCVRGREVVGRGLLQVGEVAGDGRERVALGQPLAGLGAGGRVDAGCDAGGLRRLPDGDERRLELPGDGGVVGETPADGDAQVRRADVH